MTAVGEKEDRAKDRQKDNFDNRHRAVSLEPLEPGDHVWVTDQRCTGTVVKQTAPRYCSIATPSGQFRRNQRHLNSLPTPAQIEQEQSELRPYFCTSPRSIQGSRGSTQ